MKDILTKLCWPILCLFEPADVASRNQPANYKKSHRLALVAVGALFMVLSSISGVIVLTGGDLGSLIPVAVFFAAALVALVVGALGSDHAVAKIWGNQ